MILGWYCCSLANKLFLCGFHVALSVESTVDSFLYMVLFSFICPTAYLRCSVPFQSPFWLTSAGRDRVCFALGLIASPSGESAWYFQVPGKLMLWIMRFSRYFQVPWQVRESSTPSDVVYELNFSAVFPLWIIFLCCFIVRLCPHCTG